MKRIAVVLLSAAALSACTSTPTKIEGAQVSSTGAPVAAGIHITNPGIVTDLQSATFNLDNAVAVGALPADDPAPKCLHAILQQAGIEQAPGVTPAKSFEPKNDGPASAGAIAYILIQQAKAGPRGITVPVDCKAMIGTFVIDGLSAARRVATPSLLQGVLR